MLTRYRFVILCVAMSTLVTSVYLGTPLTMSVPTEGLFTAAPIATRAESDRGAAILVPLTDVVVDAVRPPKVKKHRDPNSRFFDALLGTPDASVAHRRSAVTIQCTVGSTPAALCGRPEWPQVAPNTTAFFGGGPTKLLSVVKPSSKMPRVKRVMFLRLDTCLGNYWHAVNELVIPILTTLCVSGWASCDDTPALPAEKPMLVVELPSNLIMFWGKSSKWCRCMRRPSFCFINTTASWMLERLVNLSMIHFTEPSRPDEYPIPNLKMLKVPLPVRADDAVLRLVTRCRSDVSAAVGYPFLVPERLDPLCASVFKKFRAVFGNPTALLAETPSDVVKTVRVLFVRRRPSLSGRDILNFDALEQAALQVAASQTDRNVSVRVVYMENHTIAEQQRLVREADVFIAARGAVSVYVNMLRPGTVFVSLFPATPNEAVAVGRDNTPFYPFKYYREDLTTLFLPCRAVLTTMCLMRTVNRCDMTCSPARFEHLFRQAILHVRSSSPGPIFPRLVTTRRCTGDTCADHGPLYHPDEFGVDTTPPLSPAPFLSAEAQVSDTVPPPP